MSVCIDDLPRTIFEVQFCLHLSEGWILHFGPVAGIFELLAQYHCSFCVADFNRFVVNAGAQIPLGELAVILKVLTQVVRGLGAIIEAGG